MYLLGTFLPQDRLRALATGKSLPNRTQGSVLFADISGFTPLTEALRTSYGARRGAEELTIYLDAVYNALIVEVENYGGSVIGFAGDAITCWFDEADGSSAPRAMACALAMQGVMQNFLTIELPTGGTTSLALKVATATGPARRFVVGDPRVHYVDALAGETVTRSATAEHLSQPGEVIADEATAAMLGLSLKIREWRSDPDNNERFAVIESYADDVARSPQASLPELSAEQIAEWLHKPQLGREQAFQTEFRPCAALFIRFTGIDYDSDQAEDQLNAFIQQLQASTALYDGTLLQLTIGDKGSYAYISLGALIIHENDARRAVNIALTLREATKDLDFLDPLQMGITMGTMRVGAYGGQTRRTFGALGDEVNVAARLMQNAARGDILLSESVYKATSSDFVFEQRPALTLKGKSSALNVFVVTGKQENSALRFQEPTYALPMIGRQIELQTITERLQASLKQQAQLVGIVAEAGIGKSRLTSEVIRIARDMGFAGYGGVCQEDSINASYFAWKPVWSAFFQIDASAGVELNRARIETSMTRLAPDRLIALPLLGILVGQTLPETPFTESLSPRSRQSVMISVLTDCLRAAALEQPILIIIEDMHWIDPLSEQLLLELAQSLNDSRICFLLVYRPTLESKIESLQGFTRIELSELDSAESEQAIRAKINQLYPNSSGQLPAELIDTLITRTQGNPFYLEELLNYFHDRGLDPHDPAALSKIHLPESLHSLILSRIDQLSEKEKTTLRVASIVGRLFRASWLAGYYPELGELPLLRQHLDQLAEIEITPQHSPEPELEYIFKHIITHEVTYETLLFSTRARLHEQLASYLEALIEAQAMDESSLLDTLVFHYNRTENYEKLRSYLEKAIRAGNLACAYKTVEDYQIRYLELLAPDDPERARWLVKLAVTYSSLSDFEQAYRTIEEAKIAATTVADQISALTNHGIMASERGDFNTARPLLEEAVEMARLYNDPETIGIALSNLGVDRLLAGRLDEAKEMLEEALRLTGEVGNWHEEMNARNRLAVCLGMLNELERKEILLKELHEQAIARNSASFINVALTNLGVLAEEKYDIHAALAYHKESLAHAYQLGVPRSILLALSNTANMNIQAGNIDEGRRETLEMLKLARRYKFITRLISGLGNLSRIAYAEGQIERAVMLYGVARKHEAWSSENERTFQASLEKWALAPEVVEALLEKGAAMNFDETIDTIINTPA